jgi:hypothetical protein
VILVELSDEIGQSLDGRKRDPWASTAWMGRSPSPTPKVAAKSCAVGPTCRVARSPCVKFQVVMWSSRTRCSVAIASTGMTWCLRLRSETAAQLPASHASNSAQQAPPQSALPSSQPHTPASHLPL